MKLRRVVAVGLSVAVVLAGGLYARVADLELQHAELIAEAQDLASRASAVEGSAAHLSGLVAVAERESAERAAVLEVRQGFVDGLADLSAAFDRANGKVDVAAERTAAMSTQQTVLAERAEPDTVVAATATIDALTAEVDRAVSGWEEEQRVRLASSAPATHWQESGPEGYARVRAALDRVGGGGVGLYESASCAGGTAPACANSNGFIKYRADVAGWNESRLNWAMAHELGHIYQFRVWGAMNASSSYQSLFGGDPEFLANCMAVVRGYAGSVGCDAAQQEWASGIWVGVVR